MLNTQQIKLIKPHMPVVASDDGQFGFVDHLEGAETIKLTRDSKGQHHYIPLSWVKFVDDKVHIDRVGTQAMQEWSTEPPKGVKAAGQGFDQTADTTAKTDKSFDNKSGKFGKS